MSSKLQHLLNILGCSRYGYIRFDQFLLAFISPVTQWLKTEKRFLEFVSQFNNQFMRQRAYVEILSTREVWRARKRRKSCTRRSRVQFQPLISVLNRNMKHAALLSLIKRIFQLCYKVRIKCNSYASFVLSKLPACSISRHTHGDA